MIELSFLTIVSFILLVAGGVTVFGMTVQDLRRIGYDRHLLQNPAAYSRPHPLVSIIIDGTPSGSCIDSIWNSDYQKIDLLLSGQPAHGELLLSLTPDAVLERSSIGHAVRMFNADPSLAVVEILPVIKPPQTLWEHFHSYHHIAAAPFVSSRAGLGIVLPHPLWPIMLRQGCERNVRTRVYIVGRWLVQIANLTALVYVWYLALFSYSPTLLIAYLGIFCLWMAIAILQYSYLSLQQRVVHLVLLPVSLSYFGLLCLKAPVASIARRFKNETFMSFWSSSRRHFFI